MKILAVLGDVNPVEYGGTVVFTERDYPDQTQAVNLQPDDDSADDYGDPQYVFVNHYQVERRKLFGREWWDDSIFEMCKFCGLAHAEFRRLEVSLNPVDNARAYDIVGGYFGYHELSGGRATVELSSLWRRKLALPLYQFYRRPIGCYAGGVRSCLD